MKKALKAKAKAHEPETVEIPRAPDWVVEHPEEIQYRLIAEQPEMNDPLQEIDLTREEYIRLKDFLGSQRGW